MKAWQLLFSVPVLAAVAMVPQDPVSTDPAQADQSTIQSISALRYVTLQGTATEVSARSVVEIRLLEDSGEAMRLELLYENGDYSLLDVQGFHLLRNGETAREVRLVRGKQARMRFPRLP